jgi:hypothetical protein
MALTGGKAVWFGVNTTYRLFRLGWDGDTTMVVERTGYEQIPVTKADREWELKKWPEDTWKYDASRIPAIQPPMVSLVYDDLGNLWVERAAPATERSKVWDLFDRTGRYLGQLRAPIPLRERYFNSPVPVIRGDRVYALRDDDEGNVTIVLAHIVRGSR